MVLSLPQSVVLPANFWLQQLIASPAWCVTASMDSGAFKKATRAVRLIIWSPSNMVNPCLAQPHLSGVHACVLPMADGRIHRCYQGCQRHLHGTKKKLSMALHTAGCKVRATGDKGSTGPICQSSTYCQSYSNHIYSPCYNCFLPDLPVLYLFTARTSAYPASCGRMQPV